MQVALHAKNALGFVQIDEHQVLVHFLGAEFENTTQAK